MAILGSQIVCTLWSISVTTRRSFGAAVKSWAWSADDGGALRGRTDRLPRRPAPEHLIKSGLPTEAMVASVLVDAKYGLHLPLYRQAKMLAGQGLDLDHSTLAFWVGYAAAELTPLYQRRTRQDEKNREENESLRLRTRHKEAASKTDVGRCRIRVSRRTTPNRAPRCSSGLLNPAAEHWRAPGRSPHSRTISSSISRAIRRGRDQSAKAKGVRIALNREVIIEKSFGARLKFDTQGLSCTLEAALSQPAPAQPALIACLVRVISRHQLTTSECPLFHWLWTFIEWRGQSLLAQKTFPVRVQNFPVPRVGNFTRNALRMLGFSAAQRPDFN